MTVACGKSISSPKTTTPTNHPTNNRKDNHAVTTKVTHRCAGHKNQQPRFLFDTPAHHPNNNKHPHQEQ